VSSRMQNTMRGDCGWLRWLPGDNAMCRRSDGAEPLRSCAEDSALYNTQTAHRMRTRMRTSMSASVVINVAHLGWVASFRRFKPLTWPVWSSLVKHPVVNSTSPSSHPGHSDRSWRTRSEPKYA